MNEERTNSLEISEELIKTKIHIIRGQQVMLDSDLAEIYGYTTKAFNQQVKRNKDKFPDDFMFQLSREEIEVMVRSQNVTSRNTFQGQEGGTRYLPNAFTEQGIYMLMTVLKGELAIRQSKALIRTFKAMKDYIGQSPVLVDSTILPRLSLQIAENTRDISLLRENMMTKDDIAQIIRSFSLPERGIEYVIYAGRTFEADAAYADIYSKAKHSLFIVDNYIGPKTLMLLKSVPENIEITIFSDNVRNILRQEELQEYRKEYPEIRLSLQKTGGRFHDRYLFIDYKKQTEKIFHCGSSSKDAGSKITTISQEDNHSLYYPMIEELLLQPELQLN